MYFNRKETKSYARSLMKSTQPKPWLVTLIFLLITMGVSAIVQGIMLVPTFISLTHSVIADPYSTNSLTTGYDVFGSVLTILSGLFTTTLSAGFTAYAMKVHRQQGAGFGDLFAGFSRFGSVILVSVLIGVYSFLWYLLGLFAMLLISVLLIVFLPSAMVISAVLCIVGILLVVFLLNRVYRYSLAYHLLLDNPNMSANDAITASKQLMGGNICSLILLQLSIYFWIALAYVIFFTVATVFVVLGLGSNGSLFHFAMAGILYLVAIFSGFPLTLWLMPYVEICTVGFYQWALDRHNSQHTIPTPPMNESVHSHFDSSSNDPWDHDAPDSRTSPF